MSLIISMRLTPLHLGKQFKLAKPKLEEEKEKKWFYKDKWTQGIYNIYYFFLYS